jgi:hypothetical protein
MGLPAAQQQFPAYTDWWMVCLAKMQIFCRIMNMMRSPVLVVSSDKLA